MKKAQPHSPNTLANNSVNYPMLDSFILVITEWLNDYGQKAEARQQQYATAPIWSYEAMNLLKTIENLIGTKESPNENTENTMVISPNRNPAMQQQNVNIWRKDFKIVSGEMPQMPKAEEVQHQWKSSLYSSSAQTQG